MSGLTLDQAKRVYRAAIDAKATDGEGADWWSQVAHEMRMVCAAATVTAAAAIIEWWHYDWSCVSDRPTDAAKRIRDAAKALAN